MQNRTSISHKIILYVFFLGIFVIVVVSFYSYFTSRNAILQRTFDQLTSLRVAKKEQVEQFFNDRIKEVNLYSHLASGEQITRRHFLNHDFLSNSNDASILEPDFETFFSKGNYYIKIFIVDAGHINCYALDSASGKGQNVNTTDTSQLALVLQKVKHEKKIIIKDYHFVGNDTVARLYIASPFFGNEKNASRFVIFEVNPSSIDNIMKNKEVINGLGQSGEVYLVGPDSLMRSESRFYKHSILKLQVKTQAVRNAFVSGEGTQLLEDYRKVATLSSYSRLLIPGLNWVIISEIDKKEAMRPVYNLANEIVFLSIFITLILFLFSYIISRTIAGPIIELKNATIEVRNGNLDHLLAIKSVDELGELTENFNLMTTQLKAQQAELKAREVKLFTSFIDGQEDERQRLSRELHDGLGQMIIATKLKAETMVNTDKGITSSNISKLRLMFDGLVEEVRNISNNLMPAALQEFGLVIALKQVCNDISNHSDIQVIFESQVLENEINRRVSVYVFRIAQEALNNAVKHANATEIIVTLIGNQKMISLVVQDNGKGISFGESGNQNGRGISSMCERVKLLDGLINISKGVDNGTIVSVKIPLT